MRKIFTLLFLLANTTTIAQTKKPLTHSVYDGWKSIGERTISNDGKYAVYAINPQEADGMLVMHDLQTGNKQEAERGYGAIISQDNKYVFYKIKARFAETRQAKIKKKKADEMPKDSFAIALLGTDSIVKIPLENLLKYLRRVVAG